MSVRFKKFSQRKYMSPAVLVSICGIAWLIDSGQGATALPDQRLGNAHLVAVPETELYAALDRFKEVDSTDPSNLAPIEDFQRKLESAPSTDPWRARSWYMIGMSLYRKSLYVEAIKRFEKASQLEKVYLGEKLFALQMRMLCLRELGRAEEAVNVIDEMQKAAAPQGIKESIISRALLIKAGLQTKTDSGDVTGRQEADRTYAEWFNHYGESQHPAASEMRGDALRARVNNLLSSGQTNLAIAVSKDFLQSHSEDVFSPLIAMELKRLERGTMLLPEGDLDEICRQYQVTNAIGTHVLYEWALSKYAAGKFEHAVRLVDVVESIKSSTNDVHQVSDAVVSAALGLKVRALERLGKSDQAEIAAKQLAALQPNSPEALDVSRDIRKKQHASDQKGLLRFLLYGSLAIPAFFFLFRLTQRFRANQP